MTEATTILLKSLQDHASLHEVQPQDLLSRTCDLRFITKFKEACVHLHSQESVVFGARYHSEIREVLKCLDIEHSAIETYCEREFCESSFMPITVLDVIACVFRLDIGVTWSPDEVESHCPELEFDKDNLLKGLRDSLTYSKEGYFYKDKYVIPFHPWLRPHLSGGFTDTLVRSRGQCTLTSLRMRIAEDKLIDASRYREYFTKAHIYGPKGNSLAKLLQDPSFPEIRSGTVTVHKQLDNNSLDAQDFPLDRIEVMWSAKNGTKTIKIEEVVTKCNRSARENSKILNRYVHAIWDKGKQCFEHFDGAFRIYREESYQGRFDSTIKDNPKSGEYMKLFRLDGMVPLPIFEDLTVRYFHMNPLVLEYFGGPEQIASNGA